MATKRRSSSGRSKSGRRKKKRQADNSGLIAGLLIGGGGVAVIAIGLIVFLIANNNSGDSSDTSQSVADATDMYADDTSLSTDVATPSTTPTAQVYNDTDVAMAAPENTAVIENPSPEAEMTAENPDAAVTENEGGSDQVYRRPSEPYSLPELIERTEKSVVRIIVKNEFGGGLGSGFVIDPSGVIITNYHVIEGSKSAEAQFLDGRKAPIVGAYKVDHELDLAVLKINPPEGGLIALPVAKSLPSKGIEVATFGAPRGLSFSTSEGIVSGLRSAADVGHKAGQYVQTTAAISGGNSGGPLVNMYGEVVGANTFKRMDGESLNFAISCVDINAIAESRGEQLMAISPESIPVKLSQGYGGAENLVGTERGRILLSQIREAIILMAPLNSDPTGRITNYVERTAERTLQGRMKWTPIKKRSNVNQSTAFVIVAMYFSLTDGQEQNLVSDLNIHTVILARDVDKDGNEITAIVWDDNKTIGKATLKTLISGIVSRSMESNIKDYFNALSSEYRRALREVNN